MKKKFTKEEQELYDFYEKKIMEQAAKPIDLSLFPPLTKQQFKKMMRGCDKE